MRDHKQFSIIKYQLSITNYFLILSSFLCLGLYPNRALTATVKETAIQPTVIDSSVQGREVEVVQVQLKALGYYNGSIDGVYSPSFQNTVTRFQQEQGLQRADGVADWATRKHLQEVLSGKIKCNTNATLTEEKDKSTQSQSGNDVWWKLISFSVIGSLSAFFYAAQSIVNKKPALEAGTSEQNLLSPSAQKSPQFFLNPASQIPSPVSTEILPVEKTLVVPPLNAFEVFMADLRSADLTQQRKAIWNIAQQGDSRAVQPLVDLMIDADSQQQSLILSALAEIGTRTLKPVNRALAISMQDENPQVRQNAIRDLLRIYDTMAQMSKIVLHAMEDPDPAVQETAKYALNQMNRIRTIPEQQI
ncbi:peptidoglycan-binding protein [Anabaena sp. UHCC 0451]|uniref:peptidoglycan-binding protein n=1 Tax=Anabaena sp. UHCC 0451 TaxID=2055235 RepID=UPI002B212485|nr:peptidoglycan-binding protein [Anabaena sp. UHCC 0451]MEA5577485.1 peptidoglycan-binding protein [Anabaena sp. UHCC 0451]